MNIVILAAGIGRRMKSALPKVLHQICGKPMICHVFDAIATFKESNIVVVVPPNGTEIENTVRKFTRGKCKPKFAIQEKPLGTGDALKSAVPFLKINKPTLILFGDVPLLSKQSLKRFAKRFEKTSSLKILTTKIKQPKGYGRIIRNNRKEILLIREEADASTKEKKIVEIFAGPMLINTRVLKQLIHEIGQDNKQKEFYLTDLVAKAVQNNLAVNSLELEDSQEILGVNTIKQKLEAENILSQKKIEFYLEKGLQIKDPNNFNLRGDINFKANVTIDTGCVFDGEINLGKNVEIGPYTILKNVNIEDNVRVDAFSVIEESEIKKNSTVGPFARLRNGVVVGENCRVGNFVEIKNSVIGSSTKASHLSYIGDAEIGKDVNIGAGAITCNYDGKDKHKTTIEDNVFVGSNTSLVAPIKIKKGATIGAGSCITIDAPAKSLNVGRAKQTTIKNWKKN